ncbi:MAG: PCC domain-containing protein [Cyanobacteriota bacterium]
MRTVRLHLEPGSDLRHTLQQLAVEEQTSGFVLGVVGNLARAAFQCPGQSQPTVLSGELEIITLNGTLAPAGVHLHLSVSDGACQVWGGHLEPGSRVLGGVELLVGLFDAGVAAEPAPAAAATATAPAATAEARVEIAVLPGCPYSARALRLLRTLAIPHLVERVESQEQADRIQQLSGRTTFPQVFIDGEPVGGYDALVDLHGSGHLEALRQG